MKKHIHHIHIIILAGILGTTTALVLANIYLEKAFLSKPVTFGVAFSPRYAKELGLDPKQTYKSILEDLGAKDIRLSAYWDEIESFESTFNFDELDWYIDQAQKHQAEVILAVGYKLPRWPECRAPQWLNLSDLSYLRQRQLIMVEEVIRYFDKNPTVTAFQIENEPLLNFGVCPPPDRNFLQKEMQLVKNLTQKPIMITDSGELRSWITPMKLSDILGTTLYRKVHDKFLGDLYYPLPPWFYRAKSEVVRKFFAPNNKKTIVAELQVELWAGQPVETLPLDEQIQRFPLSQLEEIIKYAKRTGFDEFIFWGVEWWYYLVQRGHPEYLEYAKTLF